MQYQVTEQHFTNQKSIIFLFQNFFIKKQMKILPENLKFVRRIDPQPQIFSEIKRIGRALYRYKSESLTNAHLFIMIT